MLLLKILFCSVVLSVPTRSNIPAVPQTIQNQVLRFLPPEKFKDIVFAFPYFERSKRFMESCDYEITDSKILRYHYNSSDCIELLNSAVGELKSLDYRILLVFNSVSSWIEHSFKAKVDVSLNLKRQRIGDEGAAVIAKALEEEKTKLSELNLVRCSIGHQGAAALAHALQTSKVTRLNLSHNYIGVNGAFAVAKIVCGLTELNLESNRIGAIGTSVIAQELYKGETILTSLNLFGNHIGLEGVQAITSVLDKLNALDIGGNEITNEGAFVLANALKSEHCKLFELSVSVNNIRDEGIAAILEALERNKLAGLDISMNRFTYQLIERIATALEHSSLTWLDLSGNFLGFQGAAPLAKALERVQTLKTLKLERTGIDDAGALAFSNALSSGKTSLISLDLSWNKIGNVGATYIAEALSDINLTYLNLDGNEFNDQGASALKRAFKLSVLRLDERWLHN